MYNVLIIIRNVHEGPFYDEDDACYVCLLLYAYKAKMKKAIFLFNLLFFALVRSIKNLEVKRRKHELTPDYLRRYMKTQYKRRLIYTNINFHNIDNNFNNEIIRKRDFNDSDTISTSLSKIRNIKNIINKYNLKIKREDIDNLKIRTKELVIYKYNFAKKYYILISNKLKDDSSKILGVVVLFQLFSIYIRLFFQNNLSFLRRWTDEYFFNKEEIIKNMREDRKMDFYVNLLNQYGFLKRLYLGNNKIYEVMDSPFFTTLSNSLFHISESEIFLIKK
ncbi:uncharacterized protein MKS88_000006 [Plasmodium brasilianum]|uniref:uncharacterized protein n=1 Tax=Plasmodium brasilianum TaxID=5824 RepID=UPI00350E33B1|nr:hypothetical protein MKS88_000006 [Plasmodium brasilianum]